MSWRPSAPMRNIAQRAALLGNVRQFFLARNVLEVDTPLLCSAGVTDLSIEPLTVEQGASLDSTRYLQSSPEYAMKRLLAAGSGSIYQIAKAFRDGELSSRHNPEFTLLEWYRVGYDHHQLMAEVAELICFCLGERQWQKLTYREVFLRFLQLDPFTASLAQLREIAREHVDVGFDSDDRDLWLDLLMSHVIEPRLIDLGLCFVYDYPASQAALSRVVESAGVDVGQRFELYLNGMELGNGYCELTDAEEQARRFSADNEKRLKLARTQRPVDARLMAAMREGLPQCSGVAVGVDRLLMCLTQSADITDVLAFDWKRS